MNVFVDYHHGNLYHSLHLLFEKRLGFNMYRPIGYEWFTNGYWKIAEPYGNAQDTINQFLGIDDRHWNAYESLNGDYKLKDEIYHIYDPENNFQHKAITFDTFKKMQFDLIVASYPQHEFWVQLLRYQPKAKFIMQLGNTGQKTSAQNILCSTTEFIPDINQKVFTYHQEFDLSEYSYEHPTNHKKVSSFVVLLPERETYIQYRDALPEFDFKAYGPGAIDGTLSGREIAQEMKKSAFGWHVKPGGDGYGHIIHKWFAVGRPIITRSSYYRGKMAEQLLLDGITCIDLDKRNMADNLEVIRYFSSQERHTLMCANARHRFEEIVNFEKEAVGLKQFIEEII